MQANFIIQTARNNKGVTESGKNKGQSYDMLNLLLSEAPGNNRTKGEFDFTVSDDDRKWLATPLDKLPGRAITVQISAFKPFGASVQIQGHIVRDQQQVAK